MPLEFSRNTTKSLVIVVGTLDAFTGAGAFPLNVNAGAQAEVEARLGVAYYDDGLKLDPDFKPTRTTEFVDRDLKLAVSAAASAQTLFRLVADPVAADLVEQAVVVWHAPAVFSVRAGRDYVDAGGWEQKHWAFDTVLVSPYVQALMPWITAKDPTKRVGPASAASLSLVADLAGIGSISTQFLDDVVIGEDAAANFSHSRRQPAVLAEFVGAGQVLQPLVQIGAYDINHSMLGSLGVAMRRESLQVYADATLDLRRHPTSDKSRSVTEYRSVTFAADYSTGEWAAFGKLTYLDVRQPTTNGQVDYRGNQPGVIFDDNAFDYAVGGRYRLDGEAFRPYLALVRHTGKFLLSAEEPDGVTKFKQDVAVEAGITSRF